MEKFNKPDLLKIARNYKNHISLAGGYTKFKKADLLDELNKHLIFNSNTNQFTIKAHILNPFKKAKIAIKQKAIRNARNAPVEALNALVEAINAPVEAINALVEARNAPVSRKLTNADKIRILAKIAKKKQEEEERKAPVKDISLWTYREKKDYVEELDNKKDKLREIRNGISEKMRNLYSQDNYDEVLYDKLQDLRDNLAEQMTDISDVIYSITSDEQYKIDEYEESTHSLAKMDEMLKKKRLAAKNKGKGRVFY